MTILENVSLSDIVYYHIGGKARYVLKIENYEEIPQALSFISEKQIKNVQVLGLGSNVILPDGEYDGVVLWLEGDGTSPQLLDQHSIKIFAGETMDSLINFTFNNSLVGLEWAGGLPSTVGGAIRGNAGAFGSEIEKSVREVEAIDLSDNELSIRKYSHKEAEFSYRNSFFKQHPKLLIVSGTFHLESASEETLKTAQEIYQKNIEYRNTNHPMEYPSCGSVFKNIVNKDEVEKILTIWPDVRALSEGKWHHKVSMGYVINRLGFSGKRIGGAMVSPKHTNYIVNIENAKAEDVKALIKEINEKFEETFNFTPEPEVMII